MKPLIILMLAVQIAGLVTAAVTIVMRRQPAARRRPIWSSLAVSLIVISTVSFEISETHSGSLGADILQFMAPLLLGMGLATALMAIRARRGLDGPAA